ncbi:MAG: aldo/keto reductase [Desulfobacterales bacterium]|jgi:aryl-alcohol dehydrogenase-like predicted oxidoreductase/enamine deaminase RidA (YjgF/YER057c/UK114 family)
MPVLNRAKMERTMKNIVEKWDLAPDLSISRVLIGLWQIADMERDGRKLDLAATAKAMEPYVETGFTTFDMADHYGSAEEIAGIFAEEHGRESTQLFTKWVPTPGPSTRDEVRTAVQTALDRLRSDSLDLLQFHTWNYADPNYLDTLAYLQELKDEGIIRYLGMTNTDTAHLGMILHSGFEIVTNQVCFSLLDQRARNNGMLELCVQHGVTVLAFGTLAGGFLTDRWFNQPEPDWDALKTWSQMKYGRFIRETGGWDALQNVLEVVNQVAKRHNVSMANVSCRYILDQPAVGGIIVGARLGLSEHCEDNLKLFQFSLDSKDHKEIDEAVAQLRPIPGDCGDEYRRPPFLTAAGDLSDHIDSLPAPYEVSTGDDGRTRAMSGTIWEEMASYCRAVRRGNRVLVSGTTATHGERTIGGDDPGAQTHFVIDKIEGALQSLGASLKDVVRTRIYLKNRDHLKPVANAHGLRFRGIMPANTLIYADLVGSEYLVEIEAEAIVG